MDKMRFSKGIKILAALVVSFCGISVWSSLREHKAPALPLSMEIYSINRKSLAVAYQGVSVSGNQNKENSIINNVTINIGEHGKTAADGNPKPKDVKAVKDPSTSSSSKQTRTILMSYMRSGSTFTGDLFQASPDVMYMYEPLLYTNDVDDLPRNTPIKSRVIFKFFKDPSPPGTLDYTLDTLRCNLTGPNLRYMIGYSYSRSFDDYGACMKSLPKDSDNSACSPNTLKRCQRSASVISKILRLKMWEVDELLARDPELQIIHLVRDPRGITMSRNVAHYYLNIRTLCARMNKDASMSIDLAKKYPGRILTARYEDLALSPVNMAKTLFLHAGVEWTPTIADKVQDLTSPSNNSFDEKIFGTKRKNSSSTAFNWRTKLPFHTAVEIQKSCTQMMELYGYNSFTTSAEMVNLGYPSIQHDYTDKYYKGESKKSQDILV